MDQKEYLEYHKSLCDQAYSLWATSGVGDTTPMSSKDLDAQFARFALSYGSAEEEGTALLCITGTLLGGKNDFKHHCSEARKLSLRKNNDYASPSGSDSHLAIFKNFLKCEQLEICTVEAGFLVRLSDKVSRCSNLMNREEGPSVVDEKLSDTLLDIINYVCLLLAYHKAKLEEQGGGAG